MSYEGKMARNSLRKAIAYSNELLSMIAPTDELEPWVQAKINDMDHYIEAVYGYYKFGESMDEPIDSTKEYDEEMMLSEDGQVTVGDYTTKHFDICPSAQALYSSIKDKTVMIHLIVETMMLQDLLFRQEKQAIAQGSIDSDDLEKAEEFAELIMNNAKQMNLETEHAYIEDVHIAKFKQLAGVPSSEEDYDDEENGSSMDNETFTILLSPES
jgi:hypothetical protein